MMQVIVFLGLPMYPDLNLTTRHYGIVVLEATIMEGVCGVFDLVVVSIGWLFRKYSKGELQWWVFPALIAPIAVGAVVSWIKGFDTFWVLAFAGVGFLVSVAVLAFYVNGQEVMQGFSKRDTIKSMTNEQLLRIVTSGHPQEWTDEDFALIEQTLRTRGVDVPERSNSPGRR